MTLSIRDIGKQFSLKVILMRDVEIRNKAHSITKLVKILTDDQNYFYDLAMNHEM